MITSFHINFYKKIIFAFFVLVGLCSFQSASAQALPLTTELDGYAWSSNIGWISLNCRTGGSSGGNICGTSNYKVSINSDRSVTGYAWSSNVGWIKFGGLSGYPSGGGTSAVSAQVTGTYPTLTLDGWARACAGTNGGNCSSMSNSTVAGSWDGWISLRGTNYQISTNNSGFMNNSYAWGGDVVGWIDVFTNALWVKPGATLSATNCTVPQGASTCNSSVTWNITGATSPNVINTTTNDQYSSAATGNASPEAIRLGSNTIAARDGSYVLTTVTATGNCTAGTVTNGVTCELPPPTITISASNTIARIGDVVNVSWTISPLPLVGTCTVSGPGLSGSVTTGGTSVSSPLSSKTVFTITCVGAYGTISAASTVEVIPSVKEV